MQDASTQTDDRDTAPLPPQLPPTEPTLPALISQYPILTALCSGLDIHAFHALQNTCQSFRHAMAPHAPPIGNLHVRPDHLGPRGSNESEWIVRAMPPGSLQWRTTAKNEQMRLAHPVRQISFSIHTIPRPETWPAVRTWLADNARRLSEAMPSFHHSPGSQNGMSSGSMLLSAVTSLCPQAAASGSYGVWVSTNIKDISTLESTISNYRERLAQAIEAHNSKAELGQTQGTIKEPLFLDFYILDGSPVYGRVRAHEYTTSIGEEEGAMRQDVRPDTSIYCTLTHAEPRGYMDEEARDKIAHALIRQGINMVRSGNSGNLAVVCRGLTTPEQGTSGVQDLYSTITSILQEFPAPKMRELLGNESMTLDECDEAKKSVMRTLLLVPPKHSTHRVPTGHVVTVYDHMTHNLGHAVSDPGILSMVYGGREPESLQPSADAATDDEAADQPGAGDDAYQSAAEELSSDDEPPFQDAASSAGSS